MTHKLWKILTTLLLLLSLSFTYPTHSNVQAASEKTAYVDIHSNYLNVRKSPSTKSKSVGKLYNKDKIKVLSVQGDWAKVSYKGKSGYTSNDFLRYYKTMSKPTAKKITDRVIKIQGDLKTSYTKKQIKAKLSPGFTSAYINKLYNYDLWRDGTDKNGNALYSWRPTDSVDYYIWDIIWSKTDFKEYRVLAPKITNYTKKGKEYLVVSQTTTDPKNDVLERYKEEKIHLSKSSSKENWKVYHVEYVY